MSNIGYTALYRRYRPIIFSEIVGQEHITTTLINQVKNEKVAHAYLFSGPRGTGKTSAAKILSRAVNCLHNNDGNPCNECENCRGILDGSIMDVLEIDAASNNSVDNIRNIRDEIVYTPSKAKYKVYIIDEVHMLSTGAFNALLKTLEEPPAHVIFILATTEPHKLPSTIISRCQRFDFKRISTDVILERLKHIVKDTDIQIEEKALDLIAHISEGGMRDALSILDQSFSLGKQLITHEEVLEMVGIVDNDLLLDLSNSIKEKNATKAIQIIDKAFYDGKDLNNFLVKLISHYRNILMAKTLTNVSSIVELSEENLIKLKEITNNYSEKEIMDIISMLSDTLTEGKRTNFTKILLETTIIKLCNVNKIILDVQNDNKISVQTAKNGNRIEEKKISHVEIIKNSVEHEINSTLANEVSSNWSNILENMKSKGFTPLKLQYLNDISIKSLGENSVLGFVEYKQDIHAKILEDKSIVDELKNSICSVIGKDISFKIQSKKVVQEVYSELDKFKELVEQNGMQNLLNEM